MYNKEFIEDIKLRYIVVLGGGWNDASILCIWLKWNLLLGRKQIVYFLIKEMVALDGKLSNIYFSLNTLKV
jgi:hypothetical protein